VDLALGVELVEDLLLVSERADVERRDLDRQVGRATALGGERLTQPVAVLLGFVGLEGRVRPVAVERLGECRQQV
jgi:hypothetical protein